MAVYLSKDNVGKVSVIIPYYNQSEFVEDAVDSVLEQSYSNFEIILVDDGSEEPFPNIIKSEKIKIITQENKGLPFARNVGLKHASGEYIQFLDSDDMLHKYKFESQIQGLKKHNADISISGYWAFKHPNLDNGVTTNTELIEPYPLKDFVERWENGLCIPMHCFLYRRYVIDEVGGFDESLPNHEDWDFHIRVSAMNFIYCHDPFQYALYRVHSKSMCRSTDMSTGKQMVIDKYNNEFKTTSRPRKHLKDTAFIYCVRIDSDDRLANLDFAMAFMRRYFYASIYLIECDSESKIAGRYKDVNHIFIESEDPVLHRTKLINDAVKGVDERFICNIDVDAFLDPQKYIDAVALLEQHDVVYPYSGKFYDIPKYYNLNPMLEESDIDLKETGLINPSSYGGMVFFNKNVFIEGGMENERFISWGPEDNERFMRYSKLGYSVHRMPGNMFHFSHHRGINSNQDNPNYNTCVDEYNRICMMSKDELKDFIQTKFTWL